MAHRILVVDDEKLITWSIEKTLLKGNYCVETAASGEECLAQFHSFHPDLIILDIWLPDSNGLAILEQIKVLKPQIPVIMLTAYSASDAAELSRQKGACGFIGKPFDMDDLLKVVRRALAEAGCENQFNPAGTIRNIPH